MKARLSPKAFGVFILVVVVAMAAGAATNLSKGGPPTVTVTAVQLHPADVTCGVEVDCARVTWTAAVPGGTTVSSWTVVLTSKRQNGTSETKTKTVSASESPNNPHHVDMAAAFQTGTPVTSYDAKVTANYSSAVSASKVGNF